MQHHSRLKCISHVTPWMKEPIEKWMKENVKDRNTYTKIICEPDIYGWCYMRYTLKPRGDGVRESYHSYYTRVHDYFNTMPNTC